jgi:hypothetical protein
VSVFATGGAGQPADLVEAGGVEDTLDAFADGELALIVLTLDPLRAAEAERETPALLDLR